MSGKIARPCSPPRAWRRPARSELGGHSEHASVGYGYKAGVVATGLGVPGDPEIASKGWFRPRESFRHRGSVMSVGAHALTGEAKSRRY